MRYPNENLPTTNLGIPDMTNLGLVCQTSTFAQFSTEALILFGKTSLFCVVMPVSFLSAVQPASLKTLLHRLLVADPEKRCSVEDAVKLLSCARPFEPRCVRVCHCFETPSLTCSVETKLVWGGGYNNQVLDISSFWIAPLPLHTKLDVGNFQFWNFYISAGKLT